MKNGLLLDLIQESQTEPEILQNSICLRELFKGDLKESLVKVEPLIIDQRFEITQVDFMGWNVLHYIARDNCLDLLDTLLTHRSKDIFILMNAKTFGGETPFAMAIFKEHKEIALKLLELMTNEQRLTQIDEVMNKDLDHFCATFNITKGAEKVPSLAFIAFLQLQNTNQLADHAERYKFDSRVHEGYHRLNFLFNQYNQHVKSHRNNPGMCPEEELEPDDEDLASSLELTEMLSSLTF